MICNKFNSGFILFFGGEGEGCQEGEIVGSWVWGVGEIKVFGTSFVSQS